jgi:hypothetical protein
MFGSGLISIWGIVFIRDNGNSLIGHWTTDSEEWNSVDGQAKVNTVKNIKEILEGIGCKVIYNWESVNNSHTCVVTVRVNICSHLHKRGNLSKISTYNIFTLLLGACQINKKNPG